MGKKSKPRSELQAAADPAPTTTHSNATANSDAPVFSADALTRLTQTIQTNFDKAKVQEKGKSARALKDTGKPKKKDLKDNRKELLPVGNPVEKSTAPKKKRSEEETNGARGKKRARDTDEPKLQRNAPPPPPKSKPVQPKDVLPQKPGKKGNSKIDKEALLKEIIELGGTQEDLDLVNEVESDSEIEGTEFNDFGKAGKGLKNELAGFMKEIGLEGGKFDPVDEGEDWEEEAEDEDDEVEEVEEEAEEEEEEVVKAAPIAATPLSSGPKAKGSKLVIFHLVQTPFVKC